MKTILELLRWYDSLPEGSAKDLVRISLRQCIEQRIASISGMFGSHSTEKELKRIWERLDA